MHRLKRARNVKFETFAENELVGALSAFYAFCDAILCDCRPSWWLTLAGRSGTGKTYLLKDGYSFVSRMNAGWLEKPEFYHFRYSPTYVHWPDDVGLMKSGTYNYDLVTRDYANTPFLFLDEIGADRDDKGLVADVLARLLSARVGKWTMMTTNCSPQRLAEIDTRIASRLRRDGNRLVELRETKDFSLR